MLACISLAIALLAGCGGEKLTPDETEAVYERELGPGSRVDCVTGTYGWDYDCTLHIPPGRWSRHPLTSENSVDVDDEKIIDRGG